MKKLFIPELCTPEEILDQHSVALGKTGSGKSSLLRYLAEHLLRKKKRGCIIDPKGDHWGLKFSADGKEKSEFPVIAFGDFKEPKASDIPINRKSGKHVAELITSGNRPCIIGFRGWSPSDMREFWIDFASTLFNANAGELYLFIDEVHNFAPKGKILDPKSGEMIHWTNRILSEGRGLGLVCIIASQRPQKVHNDTLTCCETLIAMKVNHASDRQAVKDWIDGCGDKEQGKIVLNNIASLGKGETYVWSPEIGFGPKRIQFPKFTTFDSFAPPQLQPKLHAKDWSSVNLEAVKEKLAAVIKETLDNDPKELKKKVAELEKQLKQKGLQQPAATIIQKELDPAVIESFKSEILKHQNQSIEYYTIIETIKSHLMKYQTIFSKIGKMLDELKAAGIEINVPEPEKIKMPAVKFIIPEQIKATVKIPKEIEKYLPTIRPATRIPPPQLGIAVASVSSNGSIPEGEKKVLAALIQFPDGLERNQLTTLTGFKRSTRDAYITRLANKGYIEARHGSKVMATKAGIDILPDYEPLPTGEELQQYWFNRLPEGECKIIKHLIEQHPNAVDREELGEVTGFKRSTRDAYITRLAAKQLVDDSTRGMVKANENLF